jgi:predicted SAM-dependent methyltransferase
MRERFSPDCSRSSALASRRPIRRLNWGCGSHVATGWINSDVKDGPGIDLVADIRKGLPLTEASVDYAVSIHALPEFSYPELDTVLGELRRVLVPGGVLRLGLPDLTKGIDAYLRGDLDYFKVDADEVRSAGGRFIVHMLWYGYSRTLFTVDFMLELLEKAGFVDARECAFQTTWSGYEEIVALDNRPEESLFVEARRGLEEPELERDLYNGGVREEPEVQISGLVHSTPNDQLRGHFRVERLDSRLELVGWALGVDASVVQVEVVSGDEVVARTSPVVERPDIEQAFPDVTGSGTSGFQLAIEPSGRGKSQLRLEAALEDGQRAPLGEMEVTTSSGRRKGFFRRGG